MQTTSILAYENKKPTIPTDHDKILSVLGKEPLTYHEIAQKVYQKILLESNPKASLKAFAWRNPNKVSRRMPELVRLGKVLKVDELKICSRAKSLCSAYVLNS